MRDDEAYMMRAIKRAKQGEGLTRPNPPVGAVLVLDNQPISEGWHLQAGFKHAERSCLEKIEGNLNLKTATLYVTLEPCSSHGRTPPCTDMVIEKGIGRVVVSTVDPNPRHAGKGLKALEEAGIKVLSGVCEAEGRKLIAPFRKFIRTNMPYVTVKLASTLDGKIADSRGNSKWITGPEAREKAHCMRRISDAVMVGAATVRADNPSLLPRPSHGRKPWRVILGSNIPANARVLTDEAASRTLVREGALDTILRELAEQYDVMHVCCEGGGGLATRLIEKELVDEFSFFIAPKLMGADGLPNFDRQSSLITNMKALKFQSIERLGEDILVTATPEK